MPDFNEQSIRDVMVHRVGNKATGEGFVVSDKPLKMDEGLRERLLKYFVGTFKGEEYFQFYGDNSLEDNEMYCLTRGLFASPEDLPRVSGEVARLMYEASEHPNIKSGDVFVVYFGEVILEGEVVDALGVFKSENKESFLKVTHEDEQWSRKEGEEQGSARFGVVLDKGIDMKKLDKGVIVFNSEEEEGYMVSVVDATNRSVDTAYWFDAFLRVKQRENEYFQTQHLMRAYKEFVTEELPKQFPDATRADCADRLNRGADFFKQNENFDMKEFETEVLVQPEVVDCFADFKADYEQKFDTQLPERFEISEGAVKQQSRSYKSVIKLDKNFHIYVHGDRTLIEQGIDERGKFYKVYYNEES